MRSTASRRNAILVLAVLALVAITFRAWLRDDPSTPIALDPKQRASQPAAGGPPERILLPPDEVRTSDRASATVLAPDVRASTAPVPALRGRVIDDLGNAVPKFRLEVREPGTVLSDLYEHLLQAEPLRSDSKGEFELDEIPAGEWIIAARRASGTRSASKSVAIPYAGNPLELVLPRDASLRGRVVDAVDRPVEGAEVIRALGMTLGAVDDHQTALAARSEATGSFAIEALPAGLQHVMARREGYCDSEWTEVSIEPGEWSQVTLRMREGGRIEGHVDPSRGRTTDREIMLFSFRGSLGWRTTRSDANGRFMIENVIPQPYVIELRALENAKVLDGSDGSVRKNIQVEAGKTTEVILGELKPAIEVRGVVMLSGLPAAGFEVHAMPTDGAEDRRARATSGASGEFTLAVAGEGDYAFVVRRGQGANAWIQRRIAGPGPVDVILELPGGAIRGTVRCPEGKALARVPVTVIRPPEAAEDPRRDFMKRFARTKTDANGQFEFELLSSGVYTLRTPDGFQGDTPPDRTPFGHVIVSGIAVAGSPTEPLEIQMAAEGFVACRVLNPSHAPIAEAWLMLVDSDGRGATARYTSVTDGRGSFEFSSVAPGTYTINVIKGEVRASSAAFVVTEGKTASVEVILF